MASSLTWGSLATMLPHRLRTVNGIRCIDEVRDEDDGRGLFMMLPLDELFQDVLVHLGPDDLAKLFQLGSLLPSDVLASDPSQAFQRLDVLGSKISVLDSFFL